MNNASVNAERPAVKSVSAPKAAHPVLRPIGEVKAVFPSWDPEKYLDECWLDYGALSMILVEDVRMAHDCPLAWPPYTGIGFSEWLRANGVKIMTQKLIRSGNARQGGRWYGRYQLILGVAPEVAPKAAGR